MLVGKKTLELINVQHVYLFLRSFTFQHVLINLDISLNFGQILSKMDLLAWKWLKTSEYMLRFEICWWKMCFRTYTFIEFWELFLPTRLFHPTRLSSSRIENSSFFVNSFWRLLRLLIFINPTNLKLRCKVWYPNTHFDYLAWLLNRK